MNFKPSDHRSVDSLHIYALENLPEFTAQTNLAEEIIKSCSNYPLEDNDILVITSKIISKIENRVVTLPDNLSFDEKVDFRRNLVAQQAVRIVAKSGNTLITENHLGIIQAASGIDGSNVESNKLLLLPEDPDLSAKKISQELFKLTGKKVAIVISDTMGRAWRQGQIDLAIGSYGIDVIHNYEGGFDSYGNPLLVTQIAVADELTAAADLVKGKLEHYPIALIRGHKINHDSNHDAKLLIRPHIDDMFRMGTDMSIEEGKRDVLLSRHSVRDFKDDPIAENDIKEAIQYGLLAPSPHHKNAYRFVNVVNNRDKFLSSLKQEWIKDLEKEGMSQEKIIKKTNRGSILYSAPTLIVPCIDTSVLDNYADSKRSRAELEMFIASSGGVIYGFLLHLSTLGIGSCWIGSTFFAEETSIDSLELPKNYHALGAIAIGYPKDSKPKKDLPELDLDNLIYR